MHFFDPRGPTGIIGDLRDLPENGEELPVAVREAVAAFIRNRDGALVEESGAFCTLVPIRPCRRGERRFLRTFPSASLRPSPHGFNPRPRRLTTPSDAFPLHPDVRSYGPSTLRRAARVQRRPAARGGHDRASADGSRARATRRHHRARQRSRHEPRGEGARGAEVRSGSQTFFTHSSSVSTLDRVGPSLSTDR